MNQQAVIKRLFVITARVSKVVVATHVCRNLSRQVTEQAYILAFINFSIAQAAF